MQTRPRENHGTGRLVLKETRGTVEEKQVREDRLSKKTAKRAKNGFQRQTNDLNKPSGNLGRPTDSTRPRTARKGRGEAAVAK